MLEYALWYAAQGWRIVPLHNPITDTTGKIIGCSCGNHGACEPSVKPSWGKHPRISEWQNKATTDEAIIRGWFDRWPAMQIGLATGPASNLFVLDIDGEEGIDALKRLEAENEPMPDTWVVETGSGGLQFYFAWPTNLGTRTIQNRAKALAEQGYPGVDWRADKGQVVAPPSSNAMGAYTVVNQSPPAPMPAWLVKLVSVEPPKVTPFTPPTMLAADTQSKRVQAYLSKCYQRIATAPQGTRNQTLYASSRAAAEVVCAHHTHDPESVKSALIEAGTSAGLTPRECHQTVGSAWKEGAAAPRPLPDRPWTAPTRTRAAAVYRPPGYKAPDTALQPPAPDVEFDGLPPGFNLDDLPDMPEESPVRMTDTGNARLLSENHGPDIRYNPTSKGEGWMLWDTARWQPDPTNCSEKWAKEVSDYWFDKAEEYLASHNGNLGKDEEKVYKSILGHAKRTENKVGIQGTLFALRSEPGVTVGAEQWDGKIFNLTTKTKSIDLQSGEVYDHRREDYSTCRTNAGYDPTARCDRWQRFLAEIMVDAAGNPRPHLVAYLQRWCGYCLTGSTQEQVFAILWGKGSNGKSTFVETIRYVLGDYAKTTKATVLMAKDRTGGIPNDIAALAGSRLVTAAESDRGKHLDEGLIKEITGGDTITARFLHKEFFEFEPRFKIMLTTNNKPVIKGTDEGIWRRIHLIPFEAYFKKPNDTSNTATAPKNATSANDTLKDELRAEASGILAWMVEGVKMWKEAGGLCPPSEVVDAVKSYRKESDVLADFLEECATKTTGEGATKASVYERYTRWCETNGEHPMKQRTLTTALEERGWRESASRQNGRRWEGWALKDAPTKSTMPDWDARFGRGYH